MFLLASGIAIFYGDQSLVALIRVLSIIILISGVRNVQKAYVSKHMYFKKFFPQHWLIPVMYVLYYLAGVFLPEKYLQDEYYRKRLNQD